MQRVFHIFTVIVLLVFGVGCHNINSTPERPESPVVILYDNDVHCAVEGYAAMAALKNDILAQTPYVTTVSCGDFAQGGIVGTITSGEGIIDIMNKVGYDFVAIGNHEFDFGIEQHFKLTERLNSQVLCANFTSLITNNTVYKPYSIVRYGNTDIAFIGIITPATGTSTSPMTFWNENGNTVYSFLPQTLFDTVQQLVDQVRSQGAEYVVALCHLGDVKEGEYPTSGDLVANTSGIDVVLDGHSHSVIPCSTLYNMAGDEVVISSSGSCFENIGVLTLSTEGKFSTKLVESSSVGADSIVLALVNNIKQSALQAGNTVIGHSGFTMNAMDADGEWLVRDREMPIGNFCADAFRIVLDTDIAMINGGGIRADLKAGDISYNTLLSVFPFNNTACKASLTGQQLLDALEVAVMSLPERAGRFMQVSGLKFKVDPTVKTPVVMDNEGLFSHIGSGPRRVSDVQVLEKQNMKYLPVEASRTYTLGGINYSITQMGDDGIFRYTKLLQDNLGQDVDILARYLQILGGEIGEEYKEIENRIIIL